MKLDQVEMQRTLSAMAAEKAVLQAEVYFTLSPKAPVLLFVENGFLSFFRSLTFKVNGTKFRPL